MQSPRKTYHDTIIRTVAKVLTEAFEPLAVKARWADNQFVIATANMNISPETVTANITATISEAGISLGRTPP